MVRQVKVSNFAEVQGIVSAAAKCYNEVGVHDMKARVRVYNGTGKITINGRDIDDYFGLETLKLLANSPLVLTENEGASSTLSSTSSAVAVQARRAPSATACPAPSSCSTPSCAAT